MKYFIALLFLIGSANGQVIVGQGLTIDHSRDIHLSLDTPWLLSHGWELVDTVKWKPYYQKKKHHSHKDTIFSNGDLTFYGAGPQLGGLITKDTKISVPHGLIDTAILRYGGYSPDSLGTDLPLSWSGTVTSFKRDTLYSEKMLPMWDGNQGWVVRFDPDAKPYPWWKKALWLVTGIIMSILGFVAIEAFRAKEVHTDTKDRMN